MKQLQIPVEIENALPQGDVFVQVMQLQGETFRNVPGRKTIRVYLAGKSLFVKQHFGVGWAEIFKNLLIFKAPILGAMTEVQAIQKLDKIGIPTTPLIGYGVEGFNPASLQSFVITEDLGDIISLEDLCVDWENSPPPARFKRQLIIAAAQLAKKLHEHHLCHRDFYVCHLCLDNTLLKQGKIKLYLIDLHRMKTANEAEKLKDIAALYFSSIDIGLSARDYVRFKYYYKKQNTIFWEKVETRANALYSKFHGDKFQQKLAAERAALK